MRATTPLHLSRPAHIHATRREQEESRRVRAAIKNGEIGHRYLAPSNKTSRGGVLERDQRSDEVLIVRMWREPGSENANDEAWRGRLKRVANGSSHHFVGLGALFSLLRRLLRPDSQHRTGSKDTVSRLDVH